jgi:hypothetical protein
MRLVNCEATVVSYKEISKIFPNARCGGMGLPDPDAFDGYKAMSSSQMQFEVCALAVATLTWQLSLVVLGNCSFDRVLR